MGKIRCLKCETTIESVHRHDFKFCGCSEDKDRCFIDGGDEYFRVGWANINNVEAWCGYHKKWVPLKDYLNVPDEVEEKTTFMNKIKKLLKKLKRSR